MPHGKKMHYPLYNVYLSLIKFAFNVVSFMLSRYMPDDSFSFNILSDDVANNSNFCSEPADQEPSAATDYNSNNGSTSAEPSGAVCVDPSDGPRDAEARFPSSLSKYPTEESNYLGAHHNVAKRNLEAVFSYSAADGADGPRYGGAEDPIGSSPDASAGGGSRSKSASSPSPVHLAVHPEEWRALFADADGRKYFLQILDEKRGRCSSLHPAGFRALVVATQVPLLFFFIVLK
jgi:hypothetical protein